MQNLWKKLTFWVDKRESKVSFASRVFAYLIDWGIGGVLTGLPGVLLYGGITGRSDMFTDLYLFPTLGFSKGWSYLAGILCVIVAVIYYIYIPYKKYPGQTLGKKWTHTKIVTLDGKNPDLKTLIIRQGLGLMIIEGVALVVSNYIMQMMTLATGFYIESFWPAISSVIMLISAMLVYMSGSRRSIHDYIAKTRVALEDEVYVEPVKKEKPKQKKRHK